jgi:hypothetical protein
MNDNIPVLQPDEPETQPETRESGLALLESCTALKNMPHVYEKVKKLWGFPVFFDYMDSLMLVEQGRENRQGFPEDVYRELNTLERFFIANPAAAAHPSLMAADHEEIRQLIRERAIKVNYTAGDRR